MRSSVFAGDNGSWQVKYSTSDVPCVPSLDAQFAPNPLEPGVLTARLVPVGPVNSTARQSPALAQNSHRPPAARVITVVTAHEPASMAASMRWHISAKGGEGGESDHMPDNNHGKTLPVCGFSCCEASICWHICLCVVVVGQSRQVH